MIKDRDLNAAENVHRAGLSRIYVCGHDGSRKNNSLKFDLLNFFLDNQSYNNYMFNER